MARRAVVNKPSGDNVTIDFSKFSEKMSFSLI
jgi:hypothetical protein